MPNPLLHPFPTSALPTALLTTSKKYHETRRKPPVDLLQCPLMEMVQYSCNPPNEEVPAPGIIKCESVVRLFRQCANGLTVETTTWERRGMGKERERERESEKKGGMEK
ncbi:hypothetical protein PAAG_03401 [Paracoccidioides lutzii Pb01]|uniref:Mitochondrial export protein Som1 n=1 Tax=Paracoccidioides lutzii (strain ATCC MYA-826 / Pb01) TaxID=502779 RepID=C1GX27_PARBA|nr:hypothetical protein PAAG_03401 [Paracoccidioides lutzii Pb01]EEH41115.1 hypothetical protein PAAG_03401 [Paracoccidioides lutzii Pb01]